MSVHGKLNMKHVILRGHQHANLNQKFALISRTGR